MRRLLLVLGIAVSGPPLVAQSAQVSLSMSLDSANSRTGVRRPVIFLRNLLLDSRWYEPLDNALPLIVSYDLKLWRSRDAWIDEFVTTYTWETIVSKEPLQEEYSVTLVINNQIRRPVRFGVRDSANLYLNRALQIDVIPPRAGRFYYTLDARITALSDRDMDRLERFLAGDPDPDGPGRGSVVGRGLRRALLRLAGLPSQILTARTEVFELVPQEDD